MTDSEKRLLRTIICDRREIALIRLKDNTKYLEVCKRQEKSDDYVEELLNKLEEDERISIQDHYEGEVEKTNFEFNEVYLQGLHDTIKILALLGIFNIDVSTNIL